MWQAGLVDSRVDGQPNGQRRGGREVDGCSLKGGNP